MKLRLGLGIDFQFRSGNAPIPPVQNMTILHRATDGPGSTGTATIDDTLQLSLAAHKSYYFEGVFYPSGNGNFGFAGPTGCTGKISWDSDGGTQQNFVETIAASPSATNYFNNGAQWCKFCGTITTGATSGPFGLYSQTGDDSQSFRSFSNLIILEES